MTALAAACLAVLALAPAASSGAQEPDTSAEIWQAFEADRSKLYNTLAPAFVECFKRRDSAIDPLSPIFHGCLDWHSAVHAAYSHMALYRRTGSHAYLELVEQQVAPQGVSLIPAELAYERAKGLDLPLTENPYGFGWFLLTARERELATGKQDFRDMANYAAEQLMAWFQTRKTNGDARTFILNTAHPNYTWSLINLDVWGRHTGNSTIQAAVREASLPLLDPTLDNSCSVTKDMIKTAGGFQPTCIMRLAAISHIWGEHADTWVKARLAKLGHISPVTAPSSCHAGGLNFSRAFALHQLYLTTGNTDYRDNYVELIRYHASRPDLFYGGQYAGTPDYLCYSHWVAQFGVRTISLSYDPRPSTPDATPPPQLTPAA